MEILVNETDVFFIYSPPSPPQTHTHHLPVFPGVQMFRSDPTCIYTRILYRNRYTYYYRRVESRIAIGGPPSIRWSFISISWIILINNGRTTSRGARGKQTARISSNSNNDIIITITVMICTVPPLRFVTVVEPVGPTPVATLRWRRGGNAEGIILPSLIHYVIRIIIRMLRRMVLYYNMHGHLGRVQQTSLPLRVTTSYSRVFFFIKNHLERPILHPLLHPNPTHVSSILTG